MGFFAPTGRKVIAQGKAKRSPGLDRRIQRKPCRGGTQQRGNQNVDISPFQGFCEWWAAARIQGNVSLCPGQSHDAPLGLVCYQGLFARELNLTLNLEIF
jgi:hypothetical protein